MEPRDDGNGLDSTITQQNNQLAAQSQQISGLQSIVAIQQNEIDQLNATVSKLDIALSQCCTSYQSTTGSTVQPGTTNESPYLNQNFPNPFTQNTTISCYLPTIVQNASIVIYDLRGQELKSINIPTTGYNQVVVAGGTLPSGDYLYTLFVNGQKVDTKKTTLTH